MKTQFENKTANLQLFEEKKWNKLDSKQIGEMTFWLNIHLFHFQESFGIKDKFTFHIINYNLIEW